MMNKGCWPKRRVYIYQVVSGVDGVLNGMSDKAYIRPTTRKGNTSPSTFYGPHFTEIEKVATQGAAVV